MNEVKSDITLMRRDICALEFLSGFGGGFTAGTVARNCGYSGRSNMAVFRLMVLQRLYKVGLLDFLDRNKPAIYVITDIGRAALERAKAEGRSS